MKPFLIVLSLSFSLLAADLSIRGFGREQVARQRELEQKLQIIPDPARMRSYVQRMSARPHQAGSPASKAVADYALRLFREWGLDAHIENFEALLPYPIKRGLVMTSPVEYWPRLEEPEIPEDASSGDAGQLAPYNAYSGSGEVAAPLVYVNYGVPEDYETLHKLGIDVKGKIVIARYGKSWRGTKPKVAQEHGAVGCLIYSDPKDDGYFVSDEYPRGPMRPSQGVQRGSVMDMPLYVGDPLSPGWASEPGSRRLSLSEARTLMKIPVLPISYADAQPMLANLGGPVAPEAWRGALPITYHIGPGPSKVQLSVELDSGIRPVYDVIATIPGAEFADQWVIYGNHHDAWVNGAQDPASGAAVLLETARTLAEMMKQGWRPKRTIVLALWDAEEFGLIGSTEWVEKHSEELNKKAVAYFNSDSNGKGWLGASGSPGLEAFLREVARDVSDPVIATSLLERTESRARETGAKGEAAEFRLSPLGAGSDYVAFEHHVGIASLNLGISGEDQSGIYHSIYDSFQWYTRFSDGEFVYGKALAQLMAISLARLASAPVLPFEFGAFARAVDKYVSEIQNTAKAKGAKVDLRPVTLEAAHIRQRAAQYEKQLARSMARVRKAPAEKLAALNEALYRSERALILPEGLPGRQWYRNQLCAPGLYTGYGAKTLPGIREAVESGRWEEAAAQVENVAKSLRALNAQIQQATKLLMKL